MAVIAPQTDVYLLKVPLEIDDTNQLTFSNATAQYNYFNSLPKLTVDDFTYQRKDNVIRFGACFDDLVNYNYVMYRNDAYSEKWFYAYIDHMEYLNDNVTLIHISTDTFQTWQFDLTYKSTFVEREHVNDDTVGIHTVPEGLETGEFIRGNTGDQCNYDDEFWLVFQVTTLVSNMDAGGLGTHRLYNGIYSGLYTVLIDNYTTADRMIKQYDSEAKADAIIACFYLPKRAVTSYVTNSACIFDGQTCTIYFPNASAAATSIDTLTINRPTTIDGYTPKNNKLFTGEFCYMLGSNNSGSEAIYRFEDFRDLTTGSPLSSCDFFVYSAVGQGGNIRMVPSPHYKSSPGTMPYSSVDSVNKYGLSGGKLPICSWNSDYYTNWLTQNSVNIATSVIETGMNVVGSLATGNVIGAAGSLISGINENVRATYQASLVPPQAKGNVNCGDINFSLGNHLTVTTMTIRQEYARIIDEYFSMFGYKINRVKIPNTTGRRNWNYVKTVGCYIEADIPQEDLSQIKSMFDRGITLWHNPSTFMDYTQNNAII